MRTWRVGGAAALLGAALGFIAPAVSPAFAATHTQTGPQAAAGLLHPVSARLPATVRYTRRGAGHSHYATAGHPYTGRAPVRAFRISCVPYARQVSGIKVIGNAWQWWHKAAGVYARGDRPEVGSVLNFRSNPRMPLGHVAVVERVVNAREIQVEHANWGSFGMRGPVARGVTVIDVSEANNWSAVRVELGRGENFGSVYPTYGFIYNRPDTGVITASVQRPAPQPLINPVTSDLRPRAEQPWHTYEEVAEAPKLDAQRVVLRVQPASFER